MFSTTLLRNFNPIVVAFPVQRYICPNLNSTRICTYVTIPWFFRKLNDITYSCSSMKTATSMSSASVNCLMSSVTRNSWRRFWSFWRLCFYWEAQRSLLDLNQFGVCNQHNFVEGLHKLIKSWAATESHATTNYQESTTNCAKITNHLDRYWNKSFLILSNHNISSKETFATDVWQIFSH